MLSNYESHCLASEWQLEIFIAQLCRSSTIFALGKDFNCCNVMQQLPINAKHSCQSQLHDGPTLHSCFDHIVGNIFIRNT